jgi:hypothetical protein
MLAERWYCGSCGLGLVLMNTAMQLVTECCIAKHQVGRRNTQKIERKNLNLRTWIKRLTRKTICFSMSVLMHDTVIGLLINKIEFGVDIHAKLQV